MRKQIKFILTFLLVFIVTTGHVTASYMPANKDLPPEMAKAYAVFIDDMEIWFGIVDEDKNSFYTFEGDPWDFKGLLYAELIDFDNDGSLELLCIYNQTGEYEEVSSQVLNFDGKDFTIIHDNEDLSESDFPMRYPFMGVSANMGEIGVTKVQDKTYLYYKNEDGTGQEYWINHDYYTLEKGKWILDTALGFLEESVYDDDNNETVTTSYSRNDKPIEESEYKQTLSKFEKNQKIIVTDFEDIKRPIKFNGYDFQKFLHEKSKIAKTSAKPNYSKTMLNNKEVFCEAYNINNNNYFKLRDLAKMLSGSKKQFEVSWNDKAKSIELLSNKPYTVVGQEMIKGDGKTKNAIVNKSKIYIDGIEEAMTAYTINGNNYFKLRDIGEAFNIGIDWDSSTDTILINTNKEYTKP